VVDPGEDAGLIATDLEVDLVGLELDDRLAGADGLTDLFQPSPYAGLDHGFA
jgi:hypothetical protein